MDSLQKRFGKLLGSHRRARDFTQAELAERVGLSIDMIKKMETGATAPSFRTIEALSVALQIDPAELFTSQVPGSLLQRSMLRSLTDQLAILTDQDLSWIQGIIQAALKTKRNH